MENPKSRRPRLIGAKPAALEYGIAYTTLRDLVHRGELPVIYIGKSHRRRAWYLDRRDIETFIDTRKERA